MRTITTQRAKDICAAWHDGQWSALYSLASTGEYHIPHTLQYFKEVQSSLHPEYNLYPGELTQREEKELKALERYLLLQASLHGVPVVYEPHELYGYLIPYLAEEVNDTLAATVTPVSYMR